MGLAGGFKYQEIVTSKNMSLDYSQLQKLSLFDRETRVSDMSEHDFVWATAKGIALGIATMYGIALAIQLPLTIAKNR